MDQRVCAVGEDPATHTDMVVQGGDLGEVQAVAVKAAANVAMCELRCSSCSKSRRETAINSSRS